MIVGAVTGPLPRPQLLILGRYDTGGFLWQLGRLTPVGPEHPWTGV